MKPCPFCGHDIIKLESWQNYDHTEYAGICQNCGAQGPNDLGTSGATEMWDMRRPEDALLHQRDELAAALRDIVNTSVGQTPPSVLIAGQIEIARAALAQVDALDKSA